MATEDDCLLRFYASPLLWLLERKPAKRKKAPAVLDEGELGGSPQMALSAARRHIDRLLVRGLPNDVVFERLILEV